MVMGCHLSEEELKEFGVKRATDRKPGGGGYYVPCDVCGKLFYSQTYSTSKVYRCQDCKNEIVEVHRKLKRILKEKIEKEESEKIGVDYEHYARFESAANKFGIDYYCAIEQASTVMNKFDSVPEVMACIELLYIGVKVIPQKKIGRYKVDFCLPDAKLIIEIDGALYHQDLSKEYWRDVAIKRMIGEEWEIKHIPAESVYKHHALFGKSICKLIDDRKFELKKR